jgi:hypothetical protein
MPYLPAPCLFKRRDRLIAGVAGEACGHPAVDADLPQITLGNENEGVVVQSGLAIVADRRSRLRRGRPDQEGEQAKPEKAVEDWEKLVECELSWMYLPH